jgi:hypothetical protein
MVMAHYHPLVVGEIVLKHQERSYGHLWVSSGPSRGACDTCACTGPLKCGASKRLVEILITHVSSISKTCMFGC